MNINTIIYSLLYASIAAIGNALFAYGQKKLKLLQLST